MRNESVEKMLGRPANKNASDLAEDLLKSPNGRARSFLEDPQGNGEREFAEFVT